MVEIFRTFNGRPFEEGLAEFGPVQEELDEQIGDMSRVAHSLLAQHRHDGHAQIETEKGDIDRYLILSDERGQKAAMSIEYGRGPGDEPGDPFPNGTQGIFVLHRATGARRKNTRPHSRRRKGYRR